MGGGESKQAYEARCAAVHEAVRAFQKDFDLFFKDSLAYDTSTISYVTLSDVIQKFKDVYPTHQVYLKKFHDGSMSHGNEQRNIASFIQSDLDHKVMVRSGVSYPPDQLLNGTNVYGVQYDRLLQNYYRGAVLLGFSWKPHGKQTDLIFL